MAKTKQTEAVRPGLVPAQEPLRAYHILGLQEADCMPIVFEGRQFDLANLSDEDLALLLQHPDQVPYLTTNLDA